MTRHVHDMDYLFRRPEPFGGALSIQWTLAGFASYGVCRGCGRVGRFTSHACHNFRWVRDPERVEELKRNAAEWNARLNSTAAGSAELVVSVNGVKA